MKTHAFFTTLGLGCAWLSGCSGHNVDLDNAAAAGSSAVAGRIDAVILNHESDPISGQLTTDETRLYWSTWGGKVQSCLKTDCANTVLTYADNAAIVDAAGMPPRVSASAGHLFWTGIAPDYTLFSCPITGCTGSPTKVFRDGRGIQGLVSDSDYAYWASSLDLYRCQANGCGPTPELVASGKIQAPVVVGENAYWLDSEASGVSIRTGSKDGSGATSVLVQAARAPLYFTVNADTLLWENGTGQILSCRLPDCSGAPTVVVDDPSDSYKTSLIADDTRVYWRNDANLVQSCPLSGCTEPVTVSADEIQSFTVDSDFVYWTNHHQLDAYLGLNLHRLSKSALSAMGG